MALGSEERVSVTEGMGKQVSDLVNCPMGKGRVAMLCKMQMDL